MKNLWIIPLCFTFILIPEIYLAQSKNNQSLKKKPGKSVFFKTCNDKGIKRNNAKIYNIEEITENNDDIFEPGYIRFSYAAADVNNDNMKKIIENVTQRLLNENYELAKVEGLTTYSISKKKLTENKYPESVISVTIIWKKSFGPGYLIKPLEINKKNFDSKYAKNLSEDLKLFLGNQKNPGIYELVLGFTPKLIFNLTPQGFFNFNDNSYQPVNQSGQPVGDFGRPIASAAKYNIISLEEVNEAEITIAGDGNPVSLGSNILGVIAGVTSISIPITNPYQLFELNGFDSLNQKESSEIRNIRFWNLGAEKDFNFLNKLMDNNYGSKVYDPVTGKLIKNKYDKRQDLSDLASLDVGVNMNTNKGTLNYPMQLMDFRGFGYISAFKTGPFSIQQINIWLEGDKNKKFEFFSVKVDVNANLTGARIPFSDVLTLSMSFKIGYFQPVGF